MADSVRETGDDADSATLLRGSIAENDAEPIDDVTTQQNALASLIAPAQPPCVTVTPRPTELKIDLSLSSTSSAEGTLDVEPPVPAANAETVLTPSSRVVQGRPFIGAMVNGKAQAGIRAYGLTGERPASRKNSTVDEAGAVNDATTAGTVPLAAMPELQTAVAVSATADVPVNPPAVSAAVTTTSSETDEVSCAPVSTSSIQIDSTTTDEVATDVDQTPASQAQVENAAAVVSTATTPAAESFSFENSVSVSLEPTPAPTPVVAAPVALPVDADSSSSEPLEAVAEKIAARLSRFADRASLPEKAAQKISLLSGVKSVETSYGRIGINAAKPETLMPATASFPTPAPVAMQNASFDPMPFSLDALVKDDAGASSQLDHVAHRAVESALAVAEQFVTGDQRSVHLQFNVGGEDLAVRVELRGDKVHTTFRTDSPELSNALAREWQAVSSSQSGDRAQRLADPVFASSTSGSSTPSDSGSANQRNQGSRYGQAAEEFSTMRSSLRTQPAVAVAPVSTPALHSPASNSRRLQTFA